MARIVCSINLLLLEPHLLLRLRLLLRDGAAQRDLRLSVVSVVRGREGRGRRTLWRWQVLPGSTIPRIKLGHWRQTALAGTWRQLGRIMRLLLVTELRGNVRLLLMSMLLVESWVNAGKALFHL